MIVQSLEIVINAAYGGFSLDTEMALWLMDNNGWTIVNDKCDGADTSEYDLVSSGDFFLPSKKYDEIGFRMNPDFIECVKTLQKVHANQSFAGKQKPQVMCLSIRSLEVHVSVEQIYDGIEGVSSWITDSDAELL